MKNFISFKLAVYLARCYLFNFIMLLAGLLAIIYLFDVVELLRRAAKVENVELTMVLVMGLYKLPEVGQLIFPFAILFSAMLTFWQLTKRKELIIVRAAGLSAWQFLMPIILCGFMIGVLKLVAINPLGALFIAQYKNLEMQYLEKKTSLISISEEGLWLRQVNEKQSGEVEAVILHSDQVRMPGWELSNAIAFFFDSQNNFLRRVDSENAILEPGQWLFKEATVNQPGEIPVKVDSLSLETSLTIEDLMDSFASIETIPFWQLPQQIEILKETGFDATRLRIHLQNLLAQPLLFVAMILLAASVSLSSSRMGGGVLLIMSGVVIGFIVFFSSSFLQALGASQQIPVLIAAWFPAIISFILGISAIAALEDG
jgi:lipopolysaccharide export system permease protein